MTQTTIIRSAKRIIGNIRAPCLFAECYRRREKKARASPMEWVISFAFPGAGMRPSVYRDREYSRARAASGAAEMWPHPRDKAFARCRNSHGQYVSAVTTRRRGWFRSQFDFHDVGIIVQCVSCVWLERLMAMQIFVGIRHCIPFRLVMPTVITKRHNIVICKNDRISHCSWGGSSSFIRNKNVSRTIWSNEEKI